MAETGLQLEILLPWPPVTGITGVFHRGYTSIFPDVRGSEAANAIQGDSRGHMWLSANPGQGALFRQRKATRAAQ